MKFEGVSKNVLVGFIPDTFYRIRIKQINTSLFPNLQIEVDHMQDDGTFIGMENMTVPYSRKNKTVAEIVKKYGKPVTENDDATP